jgi:hypothetical protein
LARRYLCPVVCVTFPVDFFLLVHHTCCVQRENSHSILVGDLLVVIPGGYYCLGPVGGECDVRILNLNLPLLVQTEMVPKDLPVGSLILNDEVFLRL